jgi:pyridoxamine 5'-phosphate oxidase
MGDADNDAYFATRSWASRLGAWASQQSQPMASRAALTAAVAREAQRFGIPYAGPGSPEPEHVTVEVPRPAHWGGFRLYADAVELWVEGEFRIHDRARWTRTLSDPQVDRLPGGDPEVRHPPGGPSAAWSVTRLQP